MGAAVLIALIAAALPGIARLNPHHDVIASFAQSVGQPVPAAVSTLVVAVQLTEPGAVEQLEGPAAALGRVEGVESVTVPPDPRQWTQDAPEPLHTDIIQTVMGSVDPLWAPIQVTLTPETAPSVVPVLRETLGATQTTTWAMAGPPVTRFAQSEVVKHEQVRLLALTSGVLLACLWVLCRRFWGAVLPMTAVGAACVLLAGVIGWTGRGLGGPNVLLLPLVVVLGLSDSVYLLRAIVRRRQTTAPHDALLQALRETLPACALTTATTALGFGVLALSNSPSLREFGLFAACGVTIALFTGLGVPLVALGMSPTLDIDSRDTPRTPAWSRLAMTLAQPGRRGPTLAVALVVCALLGVVGTQATTDLRVNGALPNAHWARTEAQTVDHVLGGLVDVVFRVDTLASGATASPNAFDALIRLQADIASDPSVGQVLSFADAALWVGRQAGVTPDALTGPERMSPVRRARRFSRYYDAAESITSQFNSTPLIADNGRTYVMYVRLRDTGARAWSDLLATVAERDATENAIQVDTAGTVLFFAAAHDQVHDDAVRIISATVLTSLAVLAIVFRRWRAILGAGLVLAATGVAALAFFGLTGTGVQRLHLFAFSAALGVGVDPLVHLNAALSHQRAHDTATRLTRAVATCAVPIHRTWLVLTVGLVCLLSSRVPEIREVGLVLVVAFGANLLATATLFIAVLASEPAHRTDASRVAGPNRH